jgi:L-alanine-DL-glutamate epimerase-like enolase superfamily enzyme
MRSKEAAARAQNGAGQRQPSGVVTVAPELRIVGVDAVHCAFPLNHPLRFGAAAYAIREYVLLRVRTDAGIDGFACGLARDTPLLAALRPLGQRLVGRDPLWRGALISELLVSNVPGAAALVRAYSLIDLALWDIAGKAAGLPVHAMLGGLRNRIPALAVGGYLLEVRGEDAVVDELVGLRDQGFRHLKLMIGARDAAWTRRFIARCRTALGDETLIGLDVHYSFASLGDAIEVGRALDDAGAAFLEDPFPPHHWRHYRALARAVRTPLAAGEDVTDAQQYADLLEAVRILRVDPSSVGGLEPALRGGRLAESAGARVLPHGFAQLNAQLAGAVGAIDWVEVMAPLANGDRIGELFEDDGFRLEGGDVVLDRQPGNGIRLDWSRTESLATERWTVGR